MPSTLPPLIASLDEALALLAESVAKLGAAESIDEAQVAEKFELAAEFAWKLRACIAAELPEAAWQNREELEALIAQVQEREEATSSEQIPEPTPEQPSEQAAESGPEQASDLSVEPGPPRSEDVAPEPGAIVQTGLLLPVVQYQAHTYGGFAGDNLLFRGSTAGQLPISPLRSEAVFFNAIRPRAVAWITAVAALIAALAVFGFGISLHRQLGKIRGELSELSEARLAALQDEMRTDQRAWVGLTEANVHPLTATSGGFTIKLQNTGKTPALDVQIADVATIEDADQTTQLQEPTATSSAGTLMPGGVYTTDVWFTTSPDAITALTHDRLRAANYLHVTYKDVFHRSHSTKVCFYWSKSLPRVKPCDRYNEMN